MGKITVIEAGPEDIDDLVVVRRGFEAEAEPGLAPIGPDELRRTLFQCPARKPERTWLATIDGRPAGSITLGFPQDTNLTHVNAYAMVHPAERGCGVARALVAEALTESAQSRSFLGTWVTEGAASAWCDRLGLTSRQLVRESRLTVRAVDPAQQRSWIEECPAQAEGYRIVSWRGAYPDEFQWEICAAFDAMADAPADDVEHEQFKATPDHLREGTRSVEGLLDQFGSLALSPSGEPAGITELGVNLHRHIATQGDTAVLADHRGRALGRWLKAANLAQALAAHRDLQWLTTFNAGSNPWMLAINTDMGYRPHKDYLCYQGSLQKALEAAVRYDISRPL